MLKSFVAENIHLRKHWGIQNSMFNISREAVCWLV